MCRVVPFETVCLYMFVCMQTTKPHILEIYTAAIVNV